MKRKLFLGMILLHIIIISVNFYLDGKLEWLLAVQVLLGLCVVFISVMYLVKEKKTK